MGAAAAPLSIAATGLSAGGKVMSGFTQASNQIQAGTQTADMDQFKSQQLSDAAQYGKAQADQTDAFMRQRVMATLGTQSAIRASANTEAGSPTGLAIAARTQGQGDQQRAIKVGDLDAQAAESQSESASYSTAAQQTLNAAYANSSTSILGGFLGAGGSLFTGLSGLKFG